MLFHSKLTITYLFNLFLLSSLLFDIGRSADCWITAVMTYTQCRGYCSSKYGSSRLYYNRTNGLCQPKVDCTQYPHRVFENRCLKAGEFFKVDDMYISVPEIYSSIHSTMHHGNENIRPDQMCFPGFFSSNHRKLLAPQIYQKHYCSKAIGDQPTVYMNSHGQYFFYELTVEQQFHLVKKYVPQAYLLSLEPMIILGVEVLFLVCALHFHWSALMGRAKRRVKIVMQS